MDNREAIQLLDKLLLRGDFTDQYGDMGDSSPYEEAVEIARQAIEKQMSSIQPKQKTGRWIYMKDCEDWFCSNCKDIFMLFEGTPKDNDYNYCPNCGAKMESDNND